MPTDTDPATLVAMHEALDEYLANLNALGPVLRQTLVMWCPAMGEHRSVRPPSPVKITGVHAVRLERETPVLRFHLEAELEAGPAFSQSTPLEWIKLTHAVL